MKTTKKILVQANGTMRGPAHLTVALLSLLRVVLPLLLLVPSLSSACPSGCACRQRFVKCFSFSGAKLQSVPANIPNDTTRLDLSDNEIRSLDGHSFDGLSELETLVLSDNKIQFISSFAFRNLVKLEYLSLSSNQLLEIQPFTFQNLRLLEYLNLFGNNLTRLDGHSFSGLQNLRTLIISQNHLSQVPKAVTSSMTSLNQLKMEDNPLHCDCEAVWMRHYPLLVSESVPKKELPECVSPPDLAGLAVSDVEFEELGCEPPVISISSPVAVEVTRGTPVDMECLVVGGNPPPELQWEFQGEVLQNNIHYQVVAGETSIEGQLEPASTLTLVIAGLFPGLEGNYTCVGESAAGTSSASVLVELNSVSLPTILNEPEDVTLFVGEAFTLHCTAAFAQHYFWLRDGLTIESSATTTIRFGVGLVVSNASAGDSGLYQCYAVNNNGAVASASATVHVIEALLTCEGVVDVESVSEISGGVDYAINITRIELNRNKSPSSLLRRLRFPKSGIIELARAAEVFGAALEQIHNSSSQLGNSTTSLPSLTSCELDVLAELSGCLIQRRSPPNCSDTCFHRHYRSFDGTCNNLDKPLWGSSSYPFLRLLNPSYEDGIGLPVGWSSGDRPSAREVSQRLIKNTKVDVSTEYTHMLMQIGQFLDHDFTLAPVTPSQVSFRTGQYCDNLCTNELPCFPIPVPPGDSRITRSCISFTRTSAVCGTGAASLIASKEAIRREQINALTSFIDASHIYGSDEETASKLRGNTGQGKLMIGQLSPHSQDKHLLPFDEYSIVQCDTGRMDDRCFLAGDERVNEQVGLTAMHTVWFREHNHIAEELSKINPHWNDNRLFQESRKITIAEWQHVIYSEYLPKILGPQGIATMGSYQGYNPETNPTIFNAFATAVFRFGHSQIMPFLVRLDEEYEPLSIGPLMLRDAFFAPVRILEEGGIDPLLRGLMTNPVKQRDSVARGLNTNLTEALFAQANEVALDLASLNIQRGRDHGLPSYNKWRAYCGLKAATSSLDELSSAFSNDTILQRLKELYGDDPNKVDLWVGGLMEENVPGSQLGPTFLCLLTEQFKKLREGDRFWYERQSQFTPDQLVQLKKTSLSKVICDNGDNIRQVPMDAFTLQSQLVGCDSLPRANLQLWKECEESCNDGCSNRFLPRRSSRTHQSCSFNGKRYAHGEQWSMDKCVTCWCQVGGITCQSSCISDSL